MSNSYLFSIAGGNRYIYKQSLSNNLVLAHISADGIGYRGNEALIDTDAKKIGHQTISVALIDGANELSQVKGRRSARHRQRY